MNYLLDKGFVSLSLERGLIGDPLVLAAAGDSSSVELHASPYGKRTPECDCPPATGLGCPHRRRYSAPDADWNWESSKAEWVFGYRFYEFTAARGAELPLCIGMPTKPQQNDAITGYVCLLQYHRLTGRLLQPRASIPPTTTSRPTASSAPCTPSPSLTSTPATPAARTCNRSRSRRRDTSASPTSTRPARRAAPPVPCAGTAAPAATGASSAPRRRTAFSARTPPPALNGASTSSRR